MSENVTPVEKKTRTKSEAPRRKVPTTLKAVWHNLLRDLAYWWGHRRAR